jgi:hypothetical protein
MANMLGNLAMGVGEDEDDKPILISAPPDGTVTLPGGYLSEGGVIKEARVRELCGEDEEELSRPAVTRDFTKFINTLLVRCVERIGDHPCTQEMLDDLLIGDRDMLLQGIRIATYGDVMRLDLTCPRLDCKHEFQVDYSFTKDVKVRQLDGLVVKLRDGRDVITLDAARHTYFVPLRKGGSVEINLINGGTQRSVYTAENSQRTAAEINTMLLKRCILTIDGDPVPMAAIRSMGTADRQALLQFLTDSQPGPLWDEVKQACPECDREFPLVIDVATMFRGF